MASDAIGAEGPFEAQNDDEEASDNASSSSMEMLPGSPPYGDLDQSIPSDDESYLEDLHTAPAHMAVDETPEDLGAAKAAEHDGQKSDNSKGDADKQAPVGENLADQVRDQGRTINELTTKLDKFIEFTMSNAHAAPGTP
jgi:hypothetical protein